MGGRIDPKAVTPVAGTTYPEPFDTPCRARVRRRLGDAGGLTQFGVNALTLPPGAWSSQRHWHSDEDEFVYVLSGEVVLVTDAGEEVLRAGDAAAFPAGKSDGHCLQNRSSVEAHLLEVGSRAADDRVVYSDIDMMTGGRGGAAYVHRDGTPYPPTVRRS